MSKIKNFYLRNDSSSKHTVGESAASQSPLLNDGGVDSKATLYNNSDTATTTSATTLTDNSVIALHDEMVQLQAKINKERENILFSSAAEDHAEDDAGNKKSKPKSLDDAIDSIDGLRNMLNLNSGKKRKTATAKTVKFINPTKLLIPANNPVKTANNPVKPIKPAESKKRHKAPVKPVNATTNQDSKVTLVIDISAKLINKGALTNMDNIDIDVHRLPISANHRANSSQFVIDAHIPPGIHNLNIVQTEGSGFEGSGMPSVEGSGAPPTIIDSESIRTIQDTLNQYKILNSTVENNDVIHDSLLAEKHAKQSKQSQRKFSNFSLPEDVTMNLGFPSAKHVLQPLKVDPTLETPGNFIIADRKKPKKTNGESHYSFLETAIENPAELAGSLITRNAAKVHNDTILKLQDEVMGETGNPETQFETAGIMNEQSEYRANHKSGTNLQNDLFSVENTEPIQEVAGEQQPTSKSLNDTNFPDLPDNNVGKDPKPAKRSKKSRSQTDNAHNHFFESVEFDEHNAESASQTSDVKASSQPNLVEGKEMIKLNNESIQFGESVKEVSENAANNEPTDNTVKLYNDMNTELLDPGKEKSESNAKLNNEAIDFDDSTKELELTKELTSNTTSSDSQKKSSPSTRGLHKQVVESIDLENEFLINPEPSDNSQAQAKDIVEIGKPENDTNSEFEAIQSLAKPNKEEDSEVTSVNKVQSAEIEGGSQNELETAGGIPHNNFLGASSTSGELKTVTKSENKHGHRKGKKKTKGKLVAAELVKNEAGDTASKHKSGKETKSKDFVDKHSTAKFSHKMEAVKLLLNQNNVETKSHQSEDKLSNDLFVVDNSDNGIKASESFNEPNGVQPNITSESKSHNALFQSKSDNMLGNAELTITPTNVNLESTNDGKSFEFNNIQPQPLTVQTDTQSETQSDRKSTVNPLVALSESDPVNKVEDSVSSDVINKADTTTATTTTAATTTATTNGVVDKGGGSKLLSGRAKSG